MIDIRDIEAAAERLKGVALHTPVIENAKLNAVVGGRVLLKPECLQRTGSFKIRGAYNLLGKLSPAERARGVVAFSSGNHAQGVAAAGAALGISTKIVMPADAPKTKLANTRALGGDVVTYDRRHGNREAIARQIAEDEGRVLAPSYDHPDIIAGQGTIGLELAEDCAALGLVPDQIVICCGGGGLSSGTGLAIRHRFPDIRVCVVEPEDFDDTARSLLSGRRETNADDARSICDAIQTESPGVMPFAILQSLNADAAVVSDDAVRAAMRFAFQELKLVVEPGGVVALAAVLTGAVDTRDRITLAVLSGGNVDPDVFAACQAE